MNASMVKGQGIGKKLEDEEMSWYGNRRRANTVGCDGAKWGSWLLSYLLAG